MPTDSLVVVIGVVAAFAIFSLALFFADHSSRKH